MIKQSLQNRLLDGAAIIEHAIVPRAATPATYQDAVDAMREAAHALEHCKCGAELATVQEKL
jgi:hypothetical protein